MGKDRYVLYLSMYIMSRTLPIYLDTKILPSFFLLSFFGAGGGDEGFHPSSSCRSVGCVSRRVSSSRGGVGLFIERDVYHS